MNKKPNVNREYDAFISYSSTDREWVRELVQRLRKEHLQIWVDEDLRPGSPINHAIQEAITKSRRFVFVISKNSVFADFPVAELQTVLFDDPLNKKGKLIPLRIDTVELPAYLAHFSCLDVARNHNWFDTLVQACSDNLLRVRRSMKAKVYILDDHPIVIEGLKKLIDQQDDMQVIGSAEDASTALHQIAKLKPDIVIVDLTLGDRNGLEVIKILRVNHPNSMTMVYSTHDEHCYAERCLSAGAMGYLMKSEPSTRVLQGLRYVASGGYFFSTLPSYILPGIRMRRDPVRMLSDRQIEIFEMVGRGFDSHSIAEKLGLSAKTVDAHKANIRQKLGLASGRELLTEAVRWVEK